jgi:hypothetical protein
MFHALFDRSIVGLTRIAIPGRIKAGKERSILAGLEQQLVFTQFCSGPADWNDQSQSIFHALFFLEVINVMKYFDLKKNWRYMRGTTREKL